MLLPEEEYDHFVEAQDTVWDDVLAELKAGKKESHWMWFVFPVLEGVGQSPTALFFAMGDLEETRGFAASAPSPAPVDAAIPAPAKSARAAAARRPAARPRPRNAAAKAASAARPKRADSGPGPV